MGSRNRPLEWRQGQKTIGVQGKSSTGRSWFTVSSSFRVDGNNWRGLFLNNFVQLFSCINAKQIGLEQAKLEEVMGSCALAAVQAGLSREKPWGLMSELTTEG